MRNTEKKKMSYLDKIKRNKGKVESRSKYVKTKEPEQPPPRISVIKINGNEAQSRSSKADASIKVTQPGNSVHSDKSGDSRKLFGRKSGEVEFDSDKELLDKKNISKNGQTNKPSRFGHKRAESKSQRENLKLVINEKPAAKSQRRLKSSNGGFDENVQTNPNKARINKGNRNRQVATTKKKHVKYQKTNFSFGSEVISRNPNAKLVQDAYGLEPETDESDTEEMMEEIVGNEFVHPFKQMHFKFLKIDIKKEKDPIIEEESVKQSQRPSGYGDRLMIKSGRNNQRSSRSILSAKTGVSFRKTLDNRENTFRKLTMGKIKQNYKFQILLGCTIPEVKNYFGCISASLLEYYYRKKGQRDDPHLLRRRAKKLEYTDEVLENLPEKLKNTETFKLVSDYNSKEYLAYNERLRNAQEKMKDFGTDCYMFEQFFGEILTPEEINKS